MLVVGVWSMLFWWSIAVVTIVVLERVVAFVFLSCIVAIAFICICTFCILHFVFVFAFLFLFIFRVFPSFLLLLADVAALAL